MFRIRTRCIWVTHLKKAFFPKGKQNPLCEGIASINVFYQHAISPLNVGRPEITTLESGL